MIGHELYALGPRDLSGALIESVTQFQFTDVGGGVNYNQIVHTYTVPNDRVLLLQHVAANAETDNLQGGGNYVTTLTARIDSPLDLGGPNLVDIDGFIFNNRLPRNRAQVISELPTRFAWEVNLGQGLVIAPLSLVRVIAQFGTLEQTGLLGSSIHGLLVPRGNLAFTKVAAAAFKASI